MLEETPSAAHYLVLDACPPCGSSSTRIFVISAEPFHQEDATMIAIGRNTKWGLNFESVSCPRCKTEMKDYPRRPTSFRQMLWGGYTCSKCGCEMDKWGREISATNKDLKSRE
jgi:hypothetical protein